MSPGQDHHYSSHSTIDPLPQLDCPELSAYQEMSRHRQAFSLKTCPRFPCPVRRRLPSENDSQSMSQTSQSVVSYSSKFPRPANTKLPMHIWLLVSKYLTHTYDAMQHIPACSQSDRSAPFQISAIVLYLGLKYRWRPSATPNQTHETRSVMTSRPLQCAVSFV